MNQMNLIFCLKNDPQRFELKSLNIILSLTNHRGDGSLYQCLVGLNFITSISLELNGEVCTAFRFITVTLNLTPHGYNNYKKVLGLVLEFFAIVNDVWLENDQPIHKRVYG